MRHQFLLFFITLGFLFGIVAGLMAFLITYHEMLKKYASKDIPRKVAIQAGMATFAFFLALSILAGIFLPGIISSG